MNPSTPEARTPDRAAEARTLAEKFEAHATDFATTLTSSDIRAAARLLLSASPEAQPPREGLAKRRIGWRRLRGEFQIAYRAGGGMSRGPYLTDDDYRLVDEAFAAVLAGAAPPQEPVAWQEAIEAEVEFKYSRPITEPQQGMVADLADILEGHPDPEVQRAFEIADQLYRELEAAPRLPKMLAPPKP